MNKLKHLQELTDAGIAALLTKYNTALSDAQSKQVEAQELIDEITEEMCGRGIPRAIKIANYDNPSYNIEACIKGI